MWRLNWEKINIGWIIFFIFSLLGGDKGKAASKGFAISPPVLEATLSPGSTRIFTVDLVNEGKEKAEFRIYPASISELESARQLKGKQWSCVDWITVRPKRVVLSPKTKKVVGIKITVPPGVPSSGRYAAVMFEYVPEPLPTFKEESKPRVGFVITWRLACKVILAVGRGFKRDIEITKLEAVPLESKEGKKELAFAIEVKNTGNIHTKVGGEIIIRTKRGRRQGRLIIPKQRVYPSLTQSIKVDCDLPLPLGEYLAETRINYGGFLPKKKKIPFIIGEEGERKKGVTLQAVKIFIEPISISPQDLELRIPRGGFRTNYFTITNRYPYPVKIKSHLEKPVEEVKLFTSPILIYSGKTGKVIFQVKAPQGEKVETPVTFRVFNKKTGELIKKLRVNLTVKAVTRKKINP